MPRRAISSICGSVRPSAVLDRVYACFQSGGDASLPIGVSAPCGEAMGFSSTMALASSSVEIHVLWSTTPSGP